MREGRITENGEFLSVPGRSPKVRDRTAVRSASLRKSDSLPTAELEMAILDVVRTNYGATDDQVVLSAARAVGFKSTSAQLRELLAEVVASAIATERLARRNGMLVIGVAAPSMTTPERPPSPLAQIITGGEHEQVEFKETLRWDVVLGEQNKKLEDVAVKTLAGFANRSGGTLLIGVADDGAVPGLARDFACRAVIGTSWSFISPTC